MKKIMMFFLFLTVGFLFCGMGQEKVRAAKTGEPVNVGTIEPDDEGNVMIDQGEEGILPEIINGNLTLKEGAIVDVQSDVTVNGTLTLEKEAVLNVQANVTIAGSASQNEDDTDTIKEDGNDSGTKGQDSGSKKYTNYYIGGDGTGDKTETEINVVDIAEDAQLNIIKGNVQIGTVETDNMTKRMSTEGSKVIKNIKNNGLVRLNLSPDAALLVANIKQSEQTNQRFLIAFYDDEKEEWKDAISCKYGEQPKKVIERDYKDQISEDFTFKYVVDEDDKTWNGWEVREDYYKYTDFEYQPSRRVGKNPYTYQKISFYMNIQVIPADISDYPIEKINLEAEEGEILANIELPEGFAFVDAPPADLIGEAGKKYEFEVNYADEEKAGNYNPITVTISVKEGEAEEPEEPDIPDKDDPSKPSGDNKPSGDSKPTPGDPTVETPKPPVSIPEKPAPAVPSSTSEGKCGNAVTYHYKNGVLTISGNGDMTDLACENTETLEQDASAGRKSSYGGMDAYAMKTKKIVIEGGVTRIGRGAFAYFKNLESVQIKGSKKAKVSVGQYAFAGCEKLKKVSMKNVKEINFFAFGRCKSLKKLTLSKGLTNIEKSAFYGCKKLKTVNLPSTVKKIGDYCFYGCKKLKTVKVNGNIKKAGKYMFYGAGKKVTIRCANKKANKCKFVKKAKAEGIRIKRK